MFDWQDILVRIEGENFSLDAVPPEYREVVARNLVGFYICEALRAPVVAFFRSVALSLCCSVALAVVLAPLRVPFDGVLCIAFLVLVPLLFDAFVGLS